MAISQTENATDKPLLRTLRGHASARPPFWLMRQAGRYLPEYLETRRRAGSFLGLVYNPDLAAEVTMQPLRRFGMDAAILFSDILTVPQGLGIDVTFEAGEGPRLKPLTQGGPLPVFDPVAFDAKLHPVYDAVAAIRGRLVQEGFADRALIGFAGAPWTIACYMVEGGGSRDYLTVRTAAVAREDWFTRLIDVITDATIHYLGRQIEAGAEVVQLFDSWAGTLSAAQFIQWSVAPATRIVAALNTRYPHVPVIGFPKGANLLLSEYAAISKVQGLSVDHGVPVSFMRVLSGQVSAVQGNLDPALLLAGGTVCDGAVEAILAAMAGRPFIFNLGHGIHKDTPIAHVEALARRIRTP